MPRCSSDGSCSEDGFLFGSRSCYRLTSLICRQARPGRHADGNCLYLYVRDSGSRSWILRLTIHRKRCDLGLGPFPEVPLVRARKLAAEYRSIARQGGDPRQTVSSSALTVREAVEFVIKDHRHNWSAPDADVRYRRSFELRVFPVIGDKRVDEVTVEDCFAIIHPVWRGRGSLGFRLRHQLVHLMTWAVAQEHRTDNPAQQVLARLPKVKSQRQHQPSLPASQVGPALVALEGAPVPQVVNW